MSNNETQCEWCKQPARTLFIPCESYRKALVPIGVSITGISLCERCDASAVRANDMYLKEDEVRLREGANAAVAAMTEANADTVSGQAYRALQAELVKAQKLLADPQLVAIKQRYETLAADANAFASENATLLIENARLRREVERLTRKK